MRKKTIKILGGVLAVILVFLAAAGIYVHFGNVEISAASLDFETLLKLRVYNSIDEEMAYYIEDESAAFASKWSYNTIKPLLSEENIILSDAEVALTIAGITDEFKSLFASGSLGVFSATSVTEIQKSYIANTVASGFFKVNPEKLGTPVAKESYIAFSESLLNAEDVAKLKAAIAEMEQIKENFSSDTDAETKLTLEKQISDMEALETLVYSLSETMSVLEEAEKNGGVLDEYATYTDLATLEAQLITQINSMETVRDNVNSYSSELETIKSETNSSISNFEGTISEYNTALENLRSEIYNTIQTNNGYEQTLSELTTNLVLAKTELYNQQQADQSAIQASLASTKTELTGSISDTRGSLSTSIAATNAPLASTKTELENKIAAASAGSNTSITEVKNLLLSTSNDLSDELTQLRTDFGSYQTTMAGTVSNINDRIDTLEAALNLNNHDTMQLINTIFMKLDTLDTTNLKEGVEKYYNEVTRKLGSLKNSLVNVQNNLDTSTTEGASANAQIIVLYQDIINIQEAVEDYYTNMNTRISNLDTQIEDAKAAIAADADNLDQILADVSAAMQATITAANSYTNSINGQMDDLYDAIRALSGLTSDTALISKLQGIADDLASNQDAITKQVADLEAEVNSLKEQLKATTDDYNSKVDDLSERIEVTIINGTTINVADWTEDTATGQYYVEFTNPAIVDDAHIDVQYEYSPGIKPEYSADTYNHVMRITVDRQITLAISQIFIYSNYHAASTTTP